MAKNIILCSDGTGNKGGHGAATNVYKLYNAVDLHDRNNPQITFYDDGVGTNKNKYIRALTGAFGFGFEANVVDLYEFLARNYDPGDQIYLFGFSRGAATVRAFAGFIEACGLLDRNECKDGNDQCQEGIFKEQLDKARKAYQKHKGEKDGKAAKTAADDFKAKMAIKHAEHAPNGNLKIRFIGVWDTVSALGFPQDWSPFLDPLVKTLDKGSDFIKPHNFYNYRLNENVENVYHALAIDDERKTFHPKVWNEVRSDRPKNIEQVWFAGVHSNVGGGYPRAGLSNVALHWMMTNAASHGLVFKERVQNEVRSDANVYGKLQNSRDGFAIYYRYAPRDIEELCTKKDDIKSYKDAVEKTKQRISRKKTEQKSKIKGPIKIHKTVIDRIERGTSRYAPAYIPDDFQIVATKVPDANEMAVIDAELASKQRHIARSREKRREKREQVKKWVRRRTALYRVFLGLTLAFVIALFLFWIYPPEVASGDDPPTGIGILDWLLRRLANTLHDFLPDFFEGLITYVIIFNPIYFLGIVVVLAVMYRLRKYLLQETEKAREEVRKLML